MYLKPKYKSVSDDRAESVNPSVRTALVTAFKGEIYFAFQNRCFSKVRRKSVYLCSCGQMNLPVSGG